jgi:cytochrome P450
MKNEEKRREFGHKASAKVSKRLAQLENDGDDGKPDFFGQIVRNQASAEKRLSRAEMDCNAVTFLMAGSETTATTLSGFTFFVLRHPQVYAKLVHEIRSSFTSLADINIEKATQLEYMTACIQETLRVYPPVATGFPRVVPKGGSNISGHYIPEDMSVYVSQHAAYMSPRNFKDAEKFVPERWLSGAAGEEYKDDKKEVWNPFSFGPRNCMGKKYVFPFLFIFSTSTFNSLFLLPSLSLSQSPFDGEKKKSMTWNANFFLTFD